ncbi:MAG: polyprenyl synthetase family protein [Candidatus Omnitrophica bacterium]|nr:polyprenyl synthetase family protein [Candidatus Omnitrophota bacterium]
MLKRIKTRIDNELKQYVRGIDRMYSLDKISPLLSESIKNFLIRKGKRLRPALFVISYLAFAGREARNLYRCALSLELLHDFMLIHDDIIDKSDTRRGLPSMHRMLGERIVSYKKAKFGGEELAIVVGDIIYAMAISAFMSIEENRERKEMALKKFAEAALYTGSGEFIELLCSVRHMEEIKKADIYKIYDLKTARYTFSTPLALGAMLAGAKKDDIDRLFLYGIYLGRAFQIKDDLLDMFAEEKTTGKSPLTDLKEAKRTLLLWHAYRTSSPVKRAFIKKALVKNIVGKRELGKVRKIVFESGAIEYAAKEIHGFMKRADAVLRRSRMNKRYKDAITAYTSGLLTY